MTHFPELPGEIHERLRARGIHPEKSYVDWLCAILDGSFPIRSDGTPARPEGRPLGKRRGCVSPIPMAVVIP